MSESPIDSTSKRTNVMKSRTAAFTFVEVIIALAIVSISLLALLGLQMTSIRMVRTAEISSRGVLLADEKVAETLAYGYPEQGSNSGTAEINGTALHWQSEVTDMVLGQSNGPDITGLRKIVVNVNWRQGRGRKHIQMSTYVAERKLQ